MISKGGSLIAFFRQVRAETAKVVWPIPREVRVSTFVVLIMVVFSATFFFLADLAISFGIGAGISFLGSFFH
ncbi:MAG: preprotein translocase subunit SecE [Candidatus Tokpelaia sp. JSC085]|nr:MAG: preprotein translocase subunit SecE [Candidatus Tokpelaia sp. JSC085]